MKKKDPLLKIEEHAISEGIWNSEAKDTSDIVFKSSIKFVRNLDGYVFAHKLNMKEKDKINKILIENIENNDRLSDFTIYNLDSFSKVDRMIFFERNILMNGRTYGGVIILSNDQKYYFILCNDDHIEFVTLKPGLNFDDIFIYGKKIMHNIENKLDFAFSESFGYLTSYPQNSGSGIEIFITLHLPGLIISSKINEVVVELEKQGIGVRGGWIDGYYEIYNKYSMGLAEKKIFEHTVSNFQKIVQYERENRENEYNMNKSIIEDKVWRSYGVLLSSRLISLYEAFDLISHVRLGIGLGIINYLTIKDINLLLYYIQDFHLRKRYNIEGENLNLEELRAQFLRDYLKEVI